MGNKSQTPYRLASALKECMKTTPVESITVRQVCDVCGISRQTFYRHFKDIPDLINWYFDILLHESFRQLGEGDTVYEGLIKKFTFIRKEYLFFRAGFSSDAQNNLKEHDYQMIFDFYLDLMKKKSSEPDEEIRDLLDMYCAASVYKTIRWVLNDMPCSESRLANLMLDAMPEKLRKQFVKLGIL